VLIAIILALLLRSAVAPLYLVVAVLLNYAATWAPPSTSFRAPPANRASRSSSRSSSTCSCGDRQPTTTS